MVNYGSIFKPIYTKHLDYLREVSIVKVEQIGNLEIGKYIDNNMKI